MRSIREHIAGLLVLVMCVTSGAMAVARGQAYDATGAVIICAGHGVVVAWVDRHGQPVEAPHLCPDCVLGAPDPQATCALFRVDLLLSAQATWPELPRTAPFAKLRIRKARAPPVPV